MINEQHHRRGIQTPLLTLFWLIAVCVSMSLLWLYNSKPAAFSESPQTWPAVSQLPRNANLPTLLMFAHPRCPCTRASVAELERIMTKCSSKVDARVVFFQPPNDQDWGKAGIWRAAQDIPGITIVPDPGGAEAARFGAVASGACLLYDSQGQLVFRGGITSSRGHEGNNVGRRAIESLLLQGKSTTAQTVVYGCTFQRLSNRTTGDANP